MSWRKKTLGSAKRQTIHNLQKCCFVRNMTGCTIKGIPHVHLVITHLYQLSCWLHQHFRARVLDGKVCVTVSYLDDCSLLICVSHCHFLPLGLTTFTEERYTFTLGPYSLSLAPFPEDTPTPVPPLLFSS